MAVNMHIRDLDELTHRELVRRADAAGMSLRSYVVEVLRRSHRGDAVAAKMRGATLAAPAHLDAEVLSALGRLVGAGDADAARATRALDRLVRLPIERLPITPLIQRAWELRGTSRCVMGATSRAPRRSAQRS